MTQLSSLSDARNYTSIAQLAEESGISRRTILKLIALHDIPSITLVKSVRYHRPSLLEALR